MSDPCSTEADTAAVETSLIPLELLPNGLEKHSDPSPVKNEENEEKVELIPSSLPSLEQLLRKFIDDEQKLNQADYTKRFYMIRLEQEALRQEPEYASMSACNPCHYMRNRYRDILPYDHNRVVLSTNEENPDGYMNASVIKLPGGRTRFIAAQAPLPTTIEEWWQMIAEQKIELVIMLCKLMEMSKVKCERYWPETLGKSQIWGNFEITFVEEERFSDGDYLLRVLKMDNTETGESRIVRQLHYVEWPDHGCPSGEDQLLNMIDKMAEIHLNESIPVLVHCSAGVGRTGTIIAVNHIRELLASDSLYELNLFNLVMSLRKQRASMVQTQDQYQFVHKCVARYARRKLGIPDPHLESPPPFKEDDEKPPKLIDFSSDESDNETTSVPDFPEEPRSRPQGPEELGSAAAS